MLSNDSISLVGVIDSSCCLTSDIYSELPVQPPSQHTEFDSSTSTTKSTSRTASTTIIFVVHDDFKYEEGCLFQCVVMPQQPEWIKWWVNFRPLIRGTNKRARSKPTKIDTSTCQYENVNGTIPHTFTKKAHQRPEQDRQYPWQTYVYHIRLTMQDIYPHHHAKHVSLPAFSLDHPPFLYTRWDLIAHWFWKFSQCFHYLGGMTTIH